MPQKCELCNEPANGNWHMTINSTDSTYDGQVSGEYSCPVDLCQSHMRFYDRLIQRNIKYAEERYDSSFTKRTKDAILSEILKLENDS